MQTAFPILGYDAFDGDGQCKPYWGGNVSGSITMTPNVWYHTALVRGTSNELMGYINGALSATSAGVMTTLGNSYFSLGSRDNAGQWANVQLAELAVYGYNLSAGDVALLARGISPRKFNPNNLTYYSRLLSDTHYLDERRGLAMAGAGFTKADHPRIYG